jgi:glutathione synthase/RimK-type ligase-like ATP-grasp enzyme
MRIGLITTRTGEIPKDDLDLPLYMEAARRQGDEIVMVPWGTKFADWADVDVFAFRTPWDYPDFETEFGSWLSEWREVPRIHNPIPLVEWNLDKRYLGVLGDLGVPVVPTWYPATAEETRSIISEGPLRAAASVVVKPTVSAGSRHTGRYEREDERLYQLVETILDVGKRPMVQPAIESVATVGEVGLLFFDGIFSHAIRKGPILATGGGFSNGGEYAEVVVAHKPSRRELDVARSTLDAVTDLAASRGWLPRGDRLAYARIDIVDDQGNPLLLEAELFEPSLFLDTHPAAADRYIEVLRTRAR